MSKRKGVSYDEKRARILQLFYEKKEFFTLKELEKIAPKEKGVIAQSVKDVVQTLVDDGLVRSDKIGTTLHFWAFPGENISALEQRISEASKKIAESEIVLQSLKDICERKKVMKRNVTTNQLNSCIECCLKSLQTILYYQIGKEDSEERQNLLREVEELRIKEAQLKKQVAKFSDADPEVIAKMNEKAQEYKEAANIWTDNIFAFQTWCRNKFDISMQSFNKHFNVPDDLDYLE